MNKTPSEAEALIKELIPLVADVNCDVVVGPTFPCLDRASKALAGSSVGLAAQNVYWEASGAYTGEVAIDMLKELGVGYVIIGHSERRQYFGETDETVNKRAKVILENGMIPIVCVGELLEEREAGTTNEVVATQVKGCLAGISAADVAKSVIAYEPVWAIGTGVTATAEQAQEAHAFVRSLIAETFGAEAAGRIRIQYGGSVKPGNAKELMSCADIDGALIGGAALDPTSFLEIIENGTV